LGHHSGLAIQAAGRIGALTLLAKIILDLAPAAPPLAVPSHGARHVGRLKRDREGCLMPGKLDDISEAIGRLRASVADIQRRIADNQRLQEERYADQRAALRDLAQKLDKHAASIETIRPTVAALELARSKLITWASIGFASVVLLGWIVEAAVKWLVTAILSHFQ
jgi:hypothetical protein